MKKELLTLYLVTGRYDFTEEQFLTIIEQACQHGVTLVQLREKELSTNQFYQLALKVKEVTDRYHIPLIINDRLDICLAVDAAGLHIGDDELPVSVARRLLGANKILGVSAKSLARSLEAQTEGADYLGVGAIFPTQTKDSQLTPITVLKAITKSVELPVVAIGGIKQDNILTLADSGIAGVSVVSEIMKAEDVSQTVKQLRVAAEAL
ncbi:thiamine phosphate synthase [Enterococcus pallens]|uniref:Thiamine-phosphate synthase n=1 Tax=Enterococcus pallens ATCC BAA-351 TaxID=1158607 RepID=R2SSQ2_9ENTE|nr:thiamine phosphate synthase [Enterococcus pallens]EOH91109.1 thiamine-phosphate pyrophosphorylase [Enterococcus pallens ATCC BAA-351]EOU16306.1 thiamine-phosphate pyrophosphorylase [Enterococcus pallens ATCC BAA-351]